MGCRRRGLTRTPRGPVTDRAGPVAAPGVSAAPQRRRPRRGARGESAGGGSRTHTPLRTRDFESRASAIPPLRHATRRWRRRECSKPACRRTLRPALAACKSLHPGAWRCTQRRLHRATAGRSAPPDGDLDRGSKSLTLLTFSRSARTTATRVRCGPAHMARLLDYTVADGAGKRHTARKETAAMSRTTSRLLAVITVAAVLGATAGMAAAQSAGDQQQDRSRVQQRVKDGSQPATQSQVRKRLSGNGGNGAGPTAGATGTGMSAGAQGTGQAKGYGPGNGTGNQGVGPRDGSGFGRGSGHRRVHRNRPTGQHESEPRRTGPQVAHRAVTRPAVVEPAGASRIADAGRPVRRVRARSRGDRRRPRGAPSRDRPREDDSRGRRGHRQRRTRTLRVGPAGRAFASRHAGANPAAATIPLWPPPSSRSRPLWRAVIR